MGTKCARFFRKYFSKTERKERFEIHSSEDVVLPSVNQIYIALTEHQSDDESQFLSFELNDRFEVLSKVSPDKWKVRNLVTNAEGYVWSCKMQKLDPLYQYEWYMPRMERDEAERLLLRMGKPGAFIIRESSTRANRDDYTLSVRDKLAIKHYRIRCLPNKGYAISSKITFSGLPALVRHYQHTSGGLCCTLKNACPQMDSFDRWEIPPDTVETKCILGKGNYAEVFEGRWNETIKVAIKILKDDKMDLEKFKKEANVMKELHHPRLVQLYAVCTLQNPPFIVMELFLKGNLKNYLMRESNKIAFKDLIFISTQIADGLKYLEQKRIIHRDVAARNVLVTSAHDVKLSDFGLSHKLDKDIFVDPENPELPTKWLAPEVILRKEFSVKSDVWSFGVLLYEIATRGKKEPYSEISADDIVHRVIVDGYRMTCPDYCQENFYNIMRSCWEAEPKKRPEFEKLYWALNEIDFPEYEDTKF